MAVEFSWNFGALLAFTGRNGTMFGNVFWIGGATINFGRKLRS
jgi:hypothetical protein